MEEAFSSSGMLLTGVLIRSMEKESGALGRETGSREILDNIYKRYRPHKDKGNLNTRLRRMQTAFEELMNVYDTVDISLRENKELLVRKTMGLTMECIKSHIFIATEYQEHLMRKEMRMACSQS